MLAVVFAAQPVNAASSKASAYFSPAVLNEPVSGCPNSAKRPLISSIEEGWYAAVWMRAGEPSLASEAPSSPTMWRFTDIPNWTAPSIYRISETPDGGLRMIATRLSGQGGYDPGFLKDDVDRKLTPDEQEHFRKALMSVNDVLAGPAKDCLVILDGIQLILERNQSGKYVVGQRYWQRDQPMTQMSSLLAGFAGWSH